MLHLNNICKKILAKYFKEKFNGDYSNLVVVSPDTGGAVRARRFAKRLMVKPWKGHEWGADKVEKLLEKRPNKEGMN